jgi:hypothetical protein
MSPQEVKDSSFLEIIRMLDEFSDMNKTEENLEKLPIGKKVY